MRLIKCLTVLLLFAGTAKAQQKLSLPLKDAVQMAITKSDEALLANTKAQTRSYELGGVKDNRYPDLKINGQYLRLTSADIKLKSSQESANDGSVDTDTDETPKVNRVAFGQASVVMPLFSGFKLKHSIAASENIYKAELANAAQSKEDVALRVVELYGDLYKAQRSVELLTESQKSSHQRVTDFTAKEQNGIIARNDLLKAQLQESRVQLSLADAQKNVRLINYYLVTILKLDPQTRIEVTPDNIQTDLFSTPVRSEVDALGMRKDVEALDYLKKANDAGVKAARADYYPSLALTGGYVALDLQNVVTVENAMNVGLGLSYNLSSIFKNGKQVQAVKSRAMEIGQQQAMLADKVKTDIMKAREEYDLSIKQDELYTQAVAQSDENYRITKDKYDNGLSDTNDLLDADVDDLSAKINLAYAKANRILKYYELLEATGQLTESFQLTQN